MLAGKKHTLCITAEVKPPCPGCLTPHLSYRAAMLQFGVCTSSPARV